eukprot:30893-Pelagococcus_subviridis.AAC.4
METSRSFSCDAKLEIWDGAFRVGARPRRRRRSRALHPARDGDRPPRARRRVRDGPREPRGARRRVLGARRRRSEGGVDDGGGRDVSASWRASLALPGALARGRLHECARARLASIFPRAAPSPRPPRAPRLAL